MLLPGRFAGLAYFEGNDSMKRIMAISLLMTTLVLLISGCNTIRGAGEDIEQGGQAIQSSASS